MADLDLHAAPEKCYEKLLNYSQVGGKVLVFYYPEDDYY